MERGYWEPTNGFPGGDSMARKNGAVVHDVEVPLDRGLIENEENHQAIRDQLHRVLSSLPFSTSKRYPALLNHIVEKALAGESATLKERTIGVEVFHRDPLYDTNADPVVRIAAGEVRKRLAQYYCEACHAREIHIDLPPGSYVPEFRPPLLEEHPFPEATPPSQAENLLCRNQDASQAPASPEPVMANAASTRARFLTPVLCVVVGIILGALGIQARYHTAAAHMTALDRFWAPVINSPNPAWLCLGQVYANQMQLEPNGARSRFDLPSNLGTETTKPYPLSNFSDAVTLAKISGVLESRGKAYAIHGETETTFSDLTSGPSVLIGAYDNDWTIRLSDQMRFHFEMDDSTKNEWIVDREKPGVQIGAHILGHALASTKDVYALVSRVHDPTTGQIAVLLAGVSHHGTRIAGDFVSQPEYLEDFAKHAAPDWDKQNLQIVIAADVVDGSLGRPRVVSSYVW
jgi:hypothetical protein